MKVKKNFNTIRFVVLGVLITTLLVLPLYFSLAETTTDNTKATNSADLKAVIYDSSQYARWWNWSRIGK